MSNRIGVFLNSLNTGSHESDLRAAKDLGFNLIQLPPLTEDELFGDQRQSYIDIFKQAKDDFEISSQCAGFTGDRYDSIPVVAQTCGFVPADKRERNKKEFLACAEIANEIGVKLLTTHIGAVPEETDHPDYWPTVQTMQEVLDAIGERGQSLALETGQEEPDFVPRFLNDVGRSNLGLNYDPANLILYGKAKPIDALERLRHWVWSVHAKDAKWSSQPGFEWGEEVPWGDGEVDADAFLRKLIETGFEGDIVIEREAGDKRIEDIGLAKERIEKALSG